MKDRINMADPDKPKSKLYTWLKDYRFLHALVVTYVIALGIVVLSRHYSFRSDAWDLGIFDQACYTALHGKIFYTTAEIYANPGGSIFGTHFSPILFAVLPFYAAFPTAETLLIIQTVVLAIGAYPVFFIAKNLLGNRQVSLCFSLFYLTYPHVLSVNIFDFHPDAFFVTLALFSLYFFIRGKWKPYFAFMFLSFLAKEMMPIMFIFFGVGELISLRNDVVASCRDRKVASKRLLVAIFTVIIAAAYYLAAKQAIHLFNPSPSGWIEGTSWRILGVNPLDPLSLLGKAGINLFGAVEFDLQSKLFYLVTILAPLAFLPVFKPTRLLPMASWVLLAFVSNYSPYYSLGWQYSALIVPFAVVAAVEGFHEFTRAFKLGGDKSLKIIRKLLTVGLLFSLTLTLLILPINVTAFSWTSDHNRKLNEVLDSILRGSPNASILTQYDIFPHVSNRMNSYVVPPLFPGFEKDYYFKYVESLFESRIDYVILDLNPDTRTDAHRETHLVALGDIEETGAYGLYMSVDGILVYKLGYNGSLARYEPFRIHVGLDVAIAYDTTLFAYTLPPGEYNVTYLAKISSKNYENAFTMKIRQGGNVLASMDVCGSEFKNTEDYYPFSVTFRTASSQQEVEFLITNVSANASVRIQDMWIYLNP